MTVSFTLNGVPTSINLANTARLSDALRNEANCLDVKVGCNAGDCGLCSVLVDGEVACACLVPLGQVANAKVETLRGLMTPGMLVAATPLLRTDPQPTECAAQEALGGVLCRCTGYRKILSAVCDQGGSPAEPRGAVGQSPQRLDGLPKVDGSERFGDDVAPADAWVLKVIRSPHHRARFNPAIL